MVAEAVAAALVGLVVLGLVLRPWLRRGAVRPGPAEPPEPEETPRGVALAALKDIEFDRETGKLSDSDYAYLKTKYTQAALEALREEEAVAPDDVEALIAHRVRSLRSAAAPPPPDAPSCSVCGPRPESDAQYCSTCGRRLPAHGLCGPCGAALAPGSRFCEACGSRVAA